MPPERTSHRVLVPSQGQRLFRRLTLCILLPTTNHKHHFREYYLGVESAGQLTYWVEFRQKHEGKTRRNVNAIRISGCTSLSG